MSHNINQTKRIESLSSHQLADVLNFNGYGECVAPIRSKNINGEQFLKLTEIQISLWRLPLTQSRRLWSFIQQVKLDPKQLLIELNQGSKSPNKPLKKINVRSENIINNINNAASVKSSSLTKEESIVIRNKLEGMFKTESVEDNSNKSFVHQHQKYPKLPPKPLHLKQVENDFLKSDETEDSVEEYLEPIQGNFSTENSLKNSNTFLSKYRRDSGQFSIKTESETQDFKIKPFKDRPLPPLPPAKTSFPSAESAMTDEESLGDYTPVNENKILPQHVHIESDFILPSQRPLPPLPIDNQEELPEYTPVIEDEEEVAIHVITKPAIFRRPPPPEPYFKNSLIRKTTPPLADPNTSSFKVKESLHSELRQKIKPPVRGLLPKPPTDLPYELPMPFLSYKESNLDEEIPVPEEYEIKEKVTTDKEYLEDVPCYRDTDRKGAKMLLAGLEDGAFVIRPSRQEKYVCTLSVMHGRKMFNIGIEQGNDGMLIFGSTAEDIKHPAFYTVKDLVGFYMTSPLHLYVYEKTNLLRGDLDLKESMQEIKLHKWKRQWACGYNPQILTNSFKNIPLVEIGTIVIIIFIITLRVEQKEAIRLVETR